MRKPCCKEVIVRKNRSYSRDTLYLLSLASPQEGLLLSSDGGIIMNGPLKSTIKQWKIMLRASKQTNVPRFFSASLDAASSARIERPQRLAHTDQDK